MTGSLKALVVGIAIVAAVAAGAGPASAACTVSTSVGSLLVHGSVSGVLLETSEVARAHAAPGGRGPLAAGSYPVGQGVRLVQGVEIGTLADGCGTLAGLEGDVTVHAKSRIGVVTDDAGDPVINPVSGSPELSTGPITGQFRIETVDGTVIGKLDGVLDFRLTNAGVTTCGGGPCPFVPAQGTWSTSGRARTGGGFFGVALIPFQLPGVDGWFYLDPTGTLGAAFTPIPLTEDEFDKFGSPLARFIITLYQ